MFPEVEKQNFRSPIQAPLEALLILIEKHSLTAGQVESLIARLREHVVGVRGTVKNPMTTEEVEEKCRELLVPVLGKNRSKKLINKIWNLESVADVRELRPLLTV